MPRKHNFVDLKQYCVHVLNVDVFKNVYFEDKHMRNIVYDSYIENLGLMIDYAVTHNKDIFEYLKQIKEILQESKHVKERTN